MMPETLLQNITSKSNLVRVIIIYGGCEEKDTETRIVSFSQHVRKSTRVPLIRKWRIY